MSIVMGVDQHRGQITAEWIDLVSGEISRAGARPADRVGVRRFLERFAGVEVEVEVEATTGWRFLVEELRGWWRRWCIWPSRRRRRPDGATRSAPRPTARMRAITAEPLLAGRLPESWIPPYRHPRSARAGAAAAHADRAAHRVAAADPGGALPPRLPAATAPDDRRGPQRLAAQPVSAIARQQITVSLEMIDALDVQLAPVTAQLRDYARRQTGCRALIGAYYGIGELVAVTIVAELGDCRRFANSRDAVRYAGMDITVYQSDRHLGTRASVPACSACSALGAVRGRAARPIPCSRRTAATTSRPRRASAATAPASRGRVAGGIAAPGSTRRECAPTSNAGFCSLGTIRKLAAPKTSLRSAAVNGGPPNRGPELRGKEGRHRPRNATSRAWQCLRSHGFSDRERDENCALAIAWKHAQNPTRRHRGRRHGPHYPSRASASPKSRRPDLHRAQ